MSFPVTTIYRKDKAHPSGHGYGRYVDGEWFRDRTGLMSSILIHTMNNPNKNTKFSNECAFLRDSPDVSCHDCIGKDGTIAEILPISAVAWHAGTVKAEFNNLLSYGAELHVSQGEEPTAAQIDSLTWRVKSLIASHGIRKANIETHRFAALPKGRKSDPEGWPDNEFYRWRDELYDPNWEGLWGPLPYPEHTGIAQRWRQEHAVKPLGRAVTDEYDDEVGRVCRNFLNGVIWYWNGTTGVWR